MDGKRKDPEPGSESWFGTAVRGLVPLAVASCVALAIGGAVDVVHHQQKSGEKERSAKPAAEPDATGGPRFVVGIREQGAALVVRDARTGKDVGVPVAAPAQGRYQRVAAVGERSYVVAASAADQVTFQRLDLTGAGTPEKLAGLPGATVKGASTAWSDLAVTPGGDRIAYVTYRRGGGARLDVVAPDGSARKAWTTGSSGRIGALSWAGSTLSFVYTTVKGGAPAHQLRTLDTTLASGDLRASKAVMRLPKGATTAVLSRDGHSVLAGVAQDGQVSVRSYPPAGGPASRVLWQVAADDRPARLDVDSTGEHVLAVGGDGRLYLPGGRAVPAEDLLDAAW